MTNLTRSDLSPSMLTIFERVLSTLLVSGHDLGNNTTIVAVLDEGCTLRLSNGRDYYLGEADHTELRYWPEEMRSDYDIVWVDLYSDPVEGGAVGMALYGS